MDTCARCGSNGCNAVPLRPQTATPARAHHTWSRTSSSCAALRPGRPSRSAAAATAASMAEAAACAETGAGAAPLGCPSPLGCRASHRAPLRRPMRCLSPDSSCSCASSSSHNLSRGVRGQTQLPLCARHGMRCRCTIHPIQGNNGCGRPISVAARRRMTYTMYLRSSASSADRVARSSDLRRSHSATSSAGALPAIRVHRSQGHGPIAWEMEGPCRFGACHPAAAMSARPAASSLQAAGGPWWALVLASHASVTKQECLRTLIHPCRPVPAQNCRPQAGPPLPPCVPARHHQPVCGASAYVPGGHGACAPLPAVHVRPATGQRAYIAHM